MVEPTTSRLSTFRSQRPAQLSPLFSTTMNDTCYLGIDVGTGSARAVVVRADGELLASVSEDTQTFRDPKDHRIFEQSTTDIWDAICRATRAAVIEAKLPKEAIKGVGFDATCSLAVVDESGQPISVTRGDALGHHGDRNIVLWADHRAEKQAEEINMSKAVPLKFVGGTMSVCTISPSI
jgi:ribulose kinase